MHKHRKYSKGSGRWQDANRRLSPSASSAVRGILESLGNSEDFATDYLRSQYLSKYCDESLTPASQRRSAAIDKWKQQESVNLITNTRFRERDPGFNILPRVTYSKFVRFARRLTAQILGPLPDEVVLGSYSGGASTGRPRTSSSPAEKFTGQVDVTVSAELYVDIIYRLSPLLRQYGAFNLLKNVEGAVLFTVPKKTDIDRCACKEPEVNMFLQKGVGRFIRSRLRRFGINLNDQSINRKLAHKGSVDNTLATIDLSSASDSITIECVRALLPTDWFLYLNDIRSQTVIVDDETFRTEMFSSMGNGFTFELESLIFLVLARAVSYFEHTPGIISVYGDDVICPSGIFHDISFVFQEFGFQINEDKSFSTGPFRESCGGHYHNGIDVTPFYLKRAATHLTDVIRVANQLRRWAFADPARSYADPSIYKAWKLLVSYVPEILWGGSDLAIDTQLASPHTPNKQLVRLSSKKDLPARGSYLHWQNSNWKRALSGESAGDPLLTTSRCRLRRARTGAARLGDQFYEELIPSPDPL